MEFYDVKQFLEWKEGKDYMTTSRNGHCTGRRDQITQGGLPVRTLLVSLVIASVLSLFGPAAIQAAGDVGPGTNGSAYQLAGDVGPGTNG